MATVTKINLKIPQGTTYHHEFNYVDIAGDPIPITGYHARCQFRELVDDVAFFFEATSAGAGITLDEANGKVTLNITPADSTAWVIYEGVYDIEIVAPNTDVTRIVQGKVTINPEVTR